MESTTILFHRLSRSTHFLFFTHRSCIIFHRSFEDTIPNNPSPRRGRAPHPIPLITVCLEIVSLSFFFSNSSIRMTTDIRLIYDIGMWIKRLSTNGGIHRLNNCKLIIVLKLENDENSLFRLIRTLSIETINKYTMYLQCKYI
ncbi:hypothetical protein AB6A40_011310 [Gnathostoma spinigerum]|uniref:Uncharacterized protein n=1 Tax=Gnathostoma spinigerum TaxID=75299 RepID=A0ABD6EYZ6_9BILA